MLLKPNSCFAICCHIILVCTMNAWAAPPGAERGSSVVQTEFKITTKRDYLSEISKSKAVGKIVLGEPCNVGCIEIRLPTGLDPSVMTEMTVSVDFGEGTLFPTFEFTKADDDAEAARLNVFFLFQGAQSKSASLTFAYGPEVVTLDVETKAETINHLELVNNWWRVWSHQITDGVPQALLEGTKDFLYVVGQKLRVLPENRSLFLGGNESRLERQFEKTLGMLLGFQSVRLAMMIEDTEYLDRSPATQGLPRTLNLARQSIPRDFDGGNVQLESMSRMVPTDCFYVRCGSTQNYLWLRQFLIGWGGSLDNIVANPILDSDVRTRLESQLGVSAEELSRLGVDRCLKDLAIIGTDLFFAEGAGVGVIFEAKPGMEEELFRLVDSQRTTQAVAQDANHRDSTILTRQLSVFEAAGNRMRSFRLKLGPYCLVTNSLQLVTDVIQARQSNRCLASLKEYQYALAKEGVSPSTGVVFYLSDPFFRRLISPAFRIELGRRRAAMQACRRLQFASTLSEAFGENLNSAKSLVSYGYLPAGFGTQADGSTVQLQNGVAIDSLRGEPGYFTPVADLNTRRANQSEVQAYKKFMTRYRQEWPVVDPVLASVSSTATVSGQDQVAIKVHITPYARKEYSFLTRNLAPPSTWQSCLDDEELLGVSTELVARNGTNFKAHFGIVDEAVPFRIEKGSLVREGEFENHDFVTRQSFAAVSPNQLEGLEQLSGLLKALQSDARAKLPNPAPITQRRESVVDINPSAAFLSVFTPGKVFIDTTRAAYKGLLNLGTLSHVNREGRWAVYALSPLLRAQVPEELDDREYKEPAQLKLHVKSIDDTKIEEYLQAYTYINSRQQSSVVAVWLNRWACGLNSTPLAAKTAVETALGGKLQCPLGGDLVLDIATSRWQSSAWTSSRIVDEISVPPDYRFPFFEWFKGLDLSFNLTRSALQSHFVVNTSRSAISLVPITMSTSNIPEIEISFGKQTRLGNPFWRRGELGVTIETGTLKIATVKPGSPAFRFGLVAGDTIIGVNRIRPRNIEELRDLLVGQSVRGEHVDLQIRRGPDIFSVRVELPGTRMVKDL